jgi:hypothetical protein
MSNEIEEAVVNLSTYYSDISLERMMKMTHKPLACVSTEIKTKHLSNTTALLGQPTRRFFLIPFYLQAVQIP